MKKINKIVKKEDSLLKNGTGDSFLENTCCIENSFIKTPIEYFISKDNSIQRDIDTINDYNNIIIDIHEIPLAPYYLYDTNTKLVFPPIPDIFTENVIYKYFIQICNFKNDIPLHDDFQKIGIGKLDNFPKHSPLTEQIQFLKDENVHYNDSHLQHLLKIVNNRNSVIVKYDDEPLSRIQKIRDMLIYLTDTDDKSVPQELRTLLTDLIDTFEIAVKTETPQIEAIKNFLAKENDAMKTKIVQFLLTHGKMSKTETPSILKFINELTSWQSLREAPIIGVHNIEHDSAYRILDFILDCINNMCYIYPNIITQKTDYQEIKINKNWGFSQDHNYDIKKSITSYYSFLPQFYDNDYNGILSSVQEECKNIFVLATIIPCFSPIDIPGSDKELISIFDKVTSCFLYEYCLLKIYMYYINNISINKKKPISSKSTRFSDTTTDSEIDDIRIGNYGDEDDIIAGEQLNNSEQIAKLLIFFTQRFISNKANINFSYEDIMKKINRSSEREKTSKTNTLKEMSDEQRDVNKMFKKHKLGEWGKGLQKGLTQYVKETYDEERSELFTGRRSVEQDLQANNFDMDTYFIDDAAQDFVTAQEIELEELTMTHLPEDDDHGDKDGDEGY